MSLSHVLENITKIDNYIAPGLECIKFTPAQKDKSESGVKKVSIKEDGAYYQIYEDGSAEKLKKVEISLKDCLACSGCITSAESVLISQQSHEELLKVLQENNDLKATDKSEAKLVVFSLSIQPILSLALCYNLSPNECCAKLVSYLKSLGADIVLDMSVADDLALLENQKEFIARYRSKLNDKNKSALPMLASSCPGWVCYAEKTHGNFVLPFIAATKSPQQIMGSLVKHFVGQKYKGKQIYHVTVMPCYDKKLEASREDFIDKDTGIKDVDSVITAIELELMLKKSEVDLSTLEESKISQPWSTSNTEIKPELTRPLGSGSGGYADHIFIKAAKELFDIDCNQLEYKSLRNPDFREVTLEKDGEVVLNFAISNGFRNIQNVVQKLKRNKLPYHYVEIMACPSGCLNGGAQAKPQGDITNKELTAKIEEVYSSLPIRSPENNSAVFDLYNSWLEGQDSDKCASFLHTQYHAVEKTTHALTIQW